MLEYDPEENFKIDVEMANKINKMMYKGVIISYIFDTNTILFTKHKEDENYNDNDDIDCIVYRNYDENFLKNHIDNILIKKER